MSGGTNLYRMLNVLCPMHVILGRTGQIWFAGPTAQKLFVNEPLIGRKFLDIFEIRRPRAITTIEDLRKKSGMKLHMGLRDMPERELKGVLMEGPEVGQMIVNLSFGISVLDAVRDYSLTSTDFAATDLAIEMLYLVEAKSAAMAASHQLNQRLQSARIAAEEQAFTDMLTGLKNRRAFDHILSRLIETNSQFALLNVDLDYFKKVNDTLGHAAGDRVLQRVAKVLNEETRETDTVARIGGDEFVILIPGIQDQDVLNRIGSRIITRLEKPIPFNGEVCRISASIGGSLSDQYVEPNAKQMLDDADMALYASKDAGRAQMTFFNDKMRKTTLDWEMNPAKMG